MNKKELFIPFLAIGLGLTFVLVCLAVLLSNGKSKKWIACKMWIGGLLLTLSYMSCNNTKSDRDQCQLGATCYMIFISTKIEVEVIIDSNKLIYGRICGRHDENYSFSIVNIKGITVQNGNLYTNRYLLEPETEEFVLELDNKVDTGKYQFKLYSCNPKEQDKVNLIHQQELIIKK